MPLNITILQDLIIFNWL